MKCKLANFLKSNKYCSKYEQKLLKQLKMCEIRKKERTYYLLASTGLEIVELNFEILISNDFNIIYASFVMKTTSSLQVIITNRKLKICNGLITFFHKFWNYETTNLRFFFAQNLLCFFVLCLWGRPFQLRQDIQI